MPVAATGFLPVFNMPFEEFASRCLAHVSRGPYLFDAQPQRHVVKKDKAYIKTTRCRHCECGSAQRSA
jgi:hypothetical protein